MSKILVLTSDLSGLLHPSLELGRRLEAAGHEVTHGSFPGARELVERHGLEFLALEPDGHAEFLAADARRGTLSRLRALESRRQEALERQGWGRFSERLTSLDSDLVLLDAELHGQIVAALGAGVNLALLNTFVSIWRRPGLPPPHRMARPGVGWKGHRLGMRLLWSQLRLRKAWRAATLYRRQVGCDRTSLMRRQARDFGLDLDRLVDASQWPIPFTFRDLPCLTLHALEFEFPHEPPDRVRYVGPMIPRDRPDERTDEADRAALADVLARRRAARDRALVYAGFGSFFTVSPGLVERLISAVADRPRLELVLSLGGRDAPDNLGELPSNVTVVGWAPQLEVLREADVAVVHGGTNSALECIACGVPMLVHCGHETDMAGVTSRIAHHGLGIIGADGDDAATIGGHLDRLLSERSFADRVEEMRAVFRTYRDDRVAERAVEDLLARRGD